MKTDDALVEELARLRLRMRELEGLLVSENDIAPGGEIAAEIWRSMVQDASPYMIVYDLAGRVLFINTTNGHYEPSELLGQSIYRWTKPEYHDALREALHKVASEGLPAYVEGEDTRAGRWFGNHFSPIKVAGRVIAIGCVCMDITDRHATESQLRESEARWRSLAESVPDSVVVLDLEGRLQFANRLRNITLDEAKKKLGIEFVPLEYRPVVKAALEQVSATGQSVDIEVQDIWEGRWFLSRIAPLWGDGKMLGTISVSHDITERKERERALQQHVDQRTNELHAANQSLLKERRVLQRLLDLHDRDRQLISYEIHDGIVQDMTGALLFIESAGESIRKTGSKAAESHAHGAQLLRNSIQEARRLINGLRPPVLDEFGLIDAIGNHLEELQLKLEVEVEFQHDVQFVRLAPVVETAIYRIVQEALNNIWHHSSSKRVFVSVRQRELHVDIVVRDWGCGFDPQQVKPKRFGLLSIRDRARLLGGEAAIESSAGQGTTIKASLPISDVLLPSSNDSAELT